MTARRWVTVLVAAYAVTIIVVAVLFADPAGDCARVGSQTRTRTASSTSPAVKVCE